MPPTTQALLEGPSPGVLEAYRTNRGTMYRGLAEHVLASDAFGDYAGQVDLVFTSPPFPLNKKKKYGNKTGDEYLEWLKGFATQLRDVVAKKGSIVIELGNGWDQGKPTMSTLPLEALLAFKEAGDFELCQQFVAYNPARLPSPAQWVNVERIRLKDAFTHVWWLSKSDRPKADNRKVLHEYSDAMKKLLATGEYNAGGRPSEHKVGEKSFLANNGGAIPPNVVNAPQFLAGNIIRTANTRSRGPYLEYCKAHDIEIHPARMSPEIPEFFIQFLTDADDLVLDPFAGSNVTGATAEGLDRRWIGIEPSWDYIRGSVGRFTTSGKKGNDQGDQPVKLRCQGIAAYHGTQCSFSAKPANECCGHHAKGIEPG